MKRDRMDEILKSAAAGAEPDIADYMAELDADGEDVSEELDRRVTAMFRSQHRMKRVRALATAAAAIVSAVFVWVSVSGILPERYLIGEVAEPTWFPGEVEKTVITNSENLFEAVYRTKDGREFYFSQEKQSNESQFNAEDESLSIGKDFYTGSEGDIFASDDSESDSEDSGTWLEWEDDGCKYRISGDAKEIELRRMAKSMAE